MQPTEDAIWVSDAAERAEEVLGRPLELREQQALKDALAELRAAHRRMVAAMDAGKLPPENYLKSFNADMKATMENCRAALGDTIFLAVFEEAGLQPEQLIDKDTFKGQWGYGPTP